MPCVSSQTFTSNTLKENVSQVHKVFYTSLTSLRPFEHRARLREAEKMVCQKKKSLLLNRARFKSQCSFLAVCDLGQIT